MLFDDSGLPTPGDTDDAVVLEDGASYERAAAVPAVDDPLETAVVAALLGRPSRGRSAVAHRCAHGLPTVLRVDPRLDDGTPFPTVFWLTCPLAELAAAYAAASERYVAFRDELGGPLPGDPSAGGMPGHIKCLHTHAGHTLATGDNVVGRMTLDRVLPLACPGPCVDTDTVLDEWGEAGTEVRS